MDPVDAPDVQTTSEQVASAIGGQLHREQSDEPRRLRKHNAPQDAQQYADAINAYSRLTASDSLFTGSHFENLAGYLQQPFEKRAPNVSLGKPADQIDEEYNFASLYNLDQDAACKVQHFEKITDFESEARNLLTEAKHGRILFMRGHPSPQWLLAIGSQLGVDAEFFQRHLDIRLARPDQFSLPSLPSSSTSMFKLRITNIGLSRVESRSETTQEDLEALRRQTADDMQRYHEQLRSHSACQLGDSVVRQCSIHDPRHFTIEQDISISVTRTEKSWLAIVWLDNGRDLSTGVAPWLASPLRIDIWQTAYLPVVQQKSNIALKPRSRLAGHMGGNDVTAHKISQSASLLHLDYGRNLDRYLLANDAFYALNELFNFAAFSEVQYLNMMESKLTKELDRSVIVEQDTPTISNLLYNQQVLERHIERLKENIRTIEKHALPLWPKAQLDSSKEKDRKKLEKSDSAATSLLQDYHYLLSRAESLSQKCSKGVQIFMNNSMINESREGINQAKAVTRLTRLAFVFIPLSFTTSFFGMNFRQLGTGELAIWVWFVVSGPIFLLSMLFMVYDVSAIRKRLPRMTNQFP